MLGVGQKLPDFRLTGAKPRFTQPEQEGYSAFAQVSREDILGRWLVLFFWPKNFTAVCPTEIVEFGRLHESFTERNCDILGCTTDGEYAHLAWKREHEGLSNSPFVWLSDPAGALVDAMGVRDAASGCALRATFLIDPHGTIQHVSVNNLFVGRNPTETLRLLDALQTDKLCPCNRPVGGQA